MALFLSLVSTAAAVIADGVTAALGTARSVQAEAGAVLMGALGTARSVRAVAGAVLTGALGTARSVRAVAGAALFCLAIGVVGAESDRGAVVLAVLAKLDALPVGDGSAGAALLGVIAVSS